MKAAVFSDLDGTIWDYNRVLPESTREAFVRLHERGHLVFLCSGRAKGHICDESVLSLPMTGIIAACGTHIEAGGRMLFEQYLPWETLQEAMSLLREESMPFILEGKDYHWLDEEDFGGDRYVARMCEELGDRVRRLDTLTPSDQVNKFSAVVTEKTDFARVRQLLSKQFELIDHNGFVVEFIPAGSGKAKGMQRVCELYGIPQEHTYAIGDSVNDVDMLTHAAYGICMGNGTDKAKSAADYVTDALHEDGFLHAMEHYRLI